VVSWPKQQETMSHCSESKVLSKGHSTSQIADK